MEIIPVVILPVIVLLVLSVSDTTRVQSGGIYHPAAGQLLFIESGSLGTLPQVKAHSQGDLGSPSLS